MPRPVTVLDREKWAKRALLIDIFTLGLLVVVGVALIRDSFVLGMNIGAAASVTEFINRLLLSVGLAVAAIAWLAYRLITSAYRDISRAF